MEEKVTTRSTAAMLDEVWDSPIGGAYLIWRFVRGFADERNCGPNVLLLYPAMAIVLDASFAAQIGHEGNLADFAFAFHDSSGKAAKSLAGMQERIIGLREWTLKSLEFAMVTRLVELNPETGEVNAVLKDEVGSSARMARAFKDNEGLKSERLGGIFARTKDTDIAYYLGVKF